jgi:hypothetical protein
MPRPTTKSQLIEVSKKEFADLEKMLAPLSMEQMIHPPAPGEWSTKDILAHLFEWQQMFFRWYEAGLRGEQPAVPAEGYKWSQLPALNQHIYETYRDLPLQKVIESFHISHHKTMELIAALPEADLFTPGRWPWMNQNTLTAYINANTGSHYRWARAEIRSKLEK